MGDCVKRRERGQQQIWRNGQQQQQQEQEQEQEQEQQQGRTFAIRSKLVRELKLRNVDNVAETTLRHGQPFGGKRGHSEA